MPKLIDQKSALKLMACSLIKQDHLSNNDFYYQVSNLINEVDPQVLPYLGFTYHEDEIGKYNELIKYGKKHNLLIKNKEVNINKVLDLFRKKILNLKNITWD